jgi:hypothetical protein
MNSFIPERLAIEPPCPSQYDSTTMSDPGEIQRLKAEANLYTAAMKPEQSGLDTTVATS